jgi:hypothetical protein
MATPLRRRSFVGSETRLTASDFTPIAVGGFGDRLNVSAQSMAWFQGQLYVGTTRHRSGKSKEQRFQPLPPEPEDRAQIWRYDP